MKKLTTLFFALAIGVTAVAQERTKISSAKIALDKGRLEEAKTYIDEAGAIIDEKGGMDVDDKQMSKYLYFKGQIYSRIGFMGSPELKEATPNSEKVAAESLIKLVEFEKTHKDRYTDEAMDAIPSAIESYLSTAFSYVEAQDFDNAYLIFVDVYKMKQNEVLGDRASVDSSTYLNAAIMAMNGKNYQGAADIYKELTTMNYKGITYTATFVDNGAPIAFSTKASMDNAIASGKYADPQIGPDQLPDFYLQLYAIYIELGKPEEAQATLEEAMAKYPDNIELLKQKIQVYIDAQDFDGALAALEEAAKKDPNNKVFFFNMGLIYQDKIKDMDKSLAAFDRAIEIDSAYYDALYMKGVYYSNQANTLVEEMNNLPLSAKTKYKKLKAQKLELDKESVKWLEKAYNVKPNEIEVVDALSQMYRAVGDMEKAVEMVKKRQALEAEAAAKAGAGQ